MAYRSVFQRFRKSNNGTAALEFALIAPILVFVLMAIVEISMMTFAAISLDGSAIEVARRIRTGQAQASGDAMNDFSTALCSQLDSMLTCGDLFYDARIMTDYSSISLDTEYDPDTDEPIVYGFSAGSSGDIVVVRVMYWWTINTPMISVFFETVPGTNKRLLATTVVFQNEPYES